MASVTRRLAEFVAGISPEDLPPEVEGRARSLVLDAVGIALRARHDAESTPALIEGVGALGLAGGDATVIGERAGYTAPGAALVNRTLMHSLDFDDTHARGSIHPSAPIVPAAFAAAEMTGAGGRETLAAIVAGYEVQTRLSMALGPSDHYARGFHPTATCGVFGAAAAAGRLFGLSPAGVADAFGIALSQAAGSMQFLVDGAWTKRLHVGHAAMCGLIAASLARAGFRGAVDAIEGKAGFLHAYAPDADAAKATEGLGGNWETMAIAVKPYPSCRYGHAAIDGLVQLRDYHGIEWDEVTSVEIGLPRTGWTIIGDPEAEKRHPKNVVDAQFSMPFAAAVALRQGGMTWDDYARHLGDPETMALCRKVSTAVDPEAEAEFPANLSATVRVTTKEGRFETFVAVPKGEPGNFPGEDELLAKFRCLALPSLGQVRARELAAALLGLGDTPIADVLALSHPSVRLEAAAGDD